MIGARMRTEAQVVAVLFPNAVGQLRGSVSVCETKGEDPLGEGSNGPLYY